MNAAARPIGGSHFNTRSEHSRETVQDTPHNHRYLQDVAQCPWYVLAAPRTFYGKVWLSAIRLISSMFVIPKESTGKFKPLINLKRLNKFVLYERFKMYGLPSQPRYLQDVHGTTRGIQDIPEASRNIVCISMVIWVDTVRYLIK